MMIKNSSGNEDGQQETGKAIYSFMDVVAGEAEHYAGGHTTPMSPVLEEIERYTLKADLFLLTMPCGTAKSLTPKTRTARPWPFLTKR
ncbi:MAG: hypothetical protein U5L00_14750 [Desulfovermiculus sp.]|nr:hypothetical protein [Desulfovermiculus sp.]